MYRGTTPTFTFALPIDGTSITKLAATFRQAGAAPIEKTLADCTVTADSVTCTLTEEETLSLKTAYPVEIQLRVGVGSARMASQVWSVSVDRILKDGAL